MGQRANTHFEKNIVEGVLQDGFNSYFKIKRELKIFFKFIVRLGFVRFACIPKFQHVLIKRNSETHLRDR